MSHTNEHSKLLSNHSWSDSDAHSDQHSDLSGSKNSSTSSASFQPLSFPGILARNSSSYSGSVIPDFSGILARNSSISSGSVIPVFSEIFGRNSLSSSASGPKIPNTNHFERPGANGKQQMNESSDHSDRTSSPTPSPSITINVSSVQPHTTQKFDLKSDAEIRHNQNRQELDNNALKSEAARKLSVKNRMFVTVDDIKEVKPHENRQVNPNAKALVPEKSDKKSDKKSHKKPNHTQILSDNEPGYIQKDDEKTIKMAGCTFIPVIYQQTSFTCNKCSNVIDRNTHGYHSSDKTSGFFGKNCKQQDYHKDCFNKAFGNPEVKSKVSPKDDSKKNPELEEVTDNLSSDFTGLDKILYYFQPDIRSKKNPFRRVKYNVGKFKCDQCGDNIKSGQTGYHCVGTTVFGKCPLNYHEKCFNKGEGTSLLKREVKLQDFERLPDKEIISATPYTTKHEFQHVKYNVGKFKCNSCNKNIQSGETGYNCMTKGLIWDCPLNYHETCFNEIINSKKGDMKDSVKNQPPLPARPYLEPNPVGSTLAKPPLPARPDKAKQKAEAAAVDKKQADAAAAAAKRQAAVDKKQADAAAAAAKRQAAAAKRQAAAAAAASEAYNKSINKVETADKAKRQADSVYKAALVAASEAKKQADSDPNNKDKKRTNNTAKKEADKAKKEADKAKQKADKAKQKAEAATKAKQKAEAAAAEAKQKADKAKQNLLKFNRKKSRRSIHKKSTSILKRKNKSKSKRNKSKKTSRKNKSKSKRNKCKKTSRKKKSKSKRNSKRKSKKNSKKNSKRSSKRKSR